MGIKFKNVTHEYKELKGGFDAIKNIDLEIEKEGEFIAILGHTGAGKSTLVQHMNALLLPTFGNLEVFGQNLPAKKGEKINDIRSKVGLVFQFPEYQLFENTIIDDIAFGPKNFKHTKNKAYENAKSAASLLKIDEFLFDKSPFKISGGQMRKVAVAGILAINPNILILDEPTRGLDPSGRDEMMETLKIINEKENKTLIIITHDMDIVAKYAKRVIVLKDGKIVFDGKKEDLFIRPDFFEFNLELPATIKILKHLENKFNIKLDYKYNKEDLIEYLKELGI